MYSHTLNLLPRREKEKRKSDALNYYTLVGGIVVVTGALVLAGLLLLFDQVYKADLARLQQEKRQAETEAAAYLPVEKEAKDLEIQLAKLKRADEQTTHWAALVAALRNFTPPGVSIKSVTFQPDGTNAQGGQAQPGQAQGNAGTSQITGTAESRRALGQFQIALSESTFLKSVEILNTTRPKGSKVVQYTISVEVDKSKLEGPKS